MDIQDTDYSCNICNIQCSDKYKLNRHLLSTKHIRNKNNTATHSHICPVCQYSCTRQDTFDRHLDTHRDVPVKMHICVKCSKAYKTTKWLWKHGQKCQPTTLEQATQDPNLILHVMEKLVAQNEQILTQPKTVKNTIQNITNINKFNLNLFLTEQCRDAINWTDFIRSINVTLKDIDISSNITDKVVGTICAELDLLGVHRRPIHCTDLKRHKTCIKDNDEWKRDSNDMVREGMKNVSLKYQKVMHEWAVDHPQWYEDQELTEKYIDMMNIFMREPEEKGILQLCKRTVLNEK